MNWIQLLGRRARVLIDIIQGITPVTDSRITAEEIRSYVGKEDPLILDIGANNGGHTLWFSRIFDNPTIHSFEPDPRAVQKFRETVSDIPNIHLHEIAVSSVNGEIEFYQSSGSRDSDQVEHAEGWDKSGSIRKPKRHLEQHPWVTFENKINVKTRSLDSWCEDHAIELIDFIWMDVQGAEVDVFRGGSQALGKCRYVYTEYSNREMYEGQYNLHKIMRHLKDFDLIARYPTDALFQNRRLL